MSTVFRGAGMDKYQDILHQARMKGDPVGPKYHRLNHQLLDWLKRNPATVTRLVGDLEKSKQILADTRAKIKAKLAQFDGQASSKEMMEKYKKWRLNQIAAGYNVEERNPGVGSAGNGL